MSRFILETVRAGEHRIFRESEHGKLLVCSLRGRAAGGWMDDATAEHLAVIALDAFTRATSPAERDQGAAAWDREEAPAFFGHAIPEELKSDTLLLQQSEGREAHERTPQQNDAVRRFIAYCDRTGIELARRTYEHATPSPGEHDGQPTARDQAGPA